MAKNNNKKPFEFRCQHGTVFSGTRDLTTLKRKSSGNPALCDALNDAIEFGAWHQREIWGTLNGFQGYDCVHITNIDVS